VAEQVKVDSAEFARYPWSGRAIERHRVQIRAALGFREFTRGDEPKIAAWLAGSFIGCGVGDVSLGSARGETRGETAAPRRG
jgi:hypothetical protein